MENTWSCCHSLSLWNLDMSYLFTEMTDKFKEVKDNYKWVYDIGNKLKALNLENFLDINYNSDYSFSKCNSCCGPFAWIYQSEVYQ